MNAILFNSLDDVHGPDLIHIIQATNQCTTDESIHHTLSNMSGWWILGKGTHATVVTNGKIAYRVSLKTNRDQFIDYAKLIYNDHIQSNHYIDILCHITAGNVHIIASPIYDMLHGDESDHPKLFTLFCNKHNKLTGGKNIRPVDMSLPQFKSISLAIDGVFEHAPDGELDFSMANTATSPEGTYILLDPIL